MKDAHIHIRISATEKIKFFDAAATSEDELLVEFAANPENLIPDMLLISTATVEVDYDYMIKGLTT
ncbi:MAG: hypothetical protein HZR80_17715, partial [Candidatus Heimdallarchaeota archaeon]